MAKVAVAFGGGPGVGPTSLHIRHTHTQGLPLRTVQSIGQVVIKVRSRRDVKFIYNKEKICKNDYEQLF